MPDAENQNRILEVAFAPVPEAVIEILIAELTEIGFDSFNEDENSLLAYISEEFFDESVIQQVIPKYPLLKDVYWRVTRMPLKNWNELWENSYEPVLIAEKCYIRAPFHPASGIQHLASNIYEIIIEPKMSFGTAHHETTALMIEWLLGEDVSGKIVLDIGCGTGVLAILALQMGAAEVFAIDYDIWAFENASENVVRNNAGEIRVIHGDVNDIPEKPFDLILANINRNVLLNQVQTYSNALKAGGTLLMSGFYSEDLPVIREQAAEQGFRFVDAREMNNWIVAKFNR